MATGKMAAVLIPVVVGSLLALGASVTTQYFTFQMQREETLRKERAAQLEKAMGLAARYSSDLGKLLGAGILADGSFTTKELPLLSAPTDTLLELSVVVSLHFRDLRGDVEALREAHAAMMQRFDQIVDAGHLRREDAAAFTERMRKESGPAMAQLRGLMDKLRQLAARQDR